MARFNLNRGGKRIGSGSGNNWSLDFDADPFFMQYKFDKGFLLGYVGDLALARINELTDRGFDANGSRFKPYADALGIEHNDAGEIVRDDKGRWNWVRVDRSAETVDMRSLQDVHEGKRMRDGLKRFPVVVNRNTNVVTIQFSGGRKAKGANGKYLPHRVRARTAQGIDGETPERSFLELPPDAFMLILNDIRAQGVIGFMYKEVQRHTQREVLKAVMAQHKARKARERAAKRNERSAIAKHNEQVKRLKAIGYDPDKEATARELWKKQQSRKRIAKYKKRK